MTHNLTTHSLHDAQLECSCSWRLTFTGAMTKAEAKKAHMRHRYDSFKAVWRRRHSISPPPSFTSWARQPESYQISDY